MVEATRRKIEARKRVAAHKAAERARDPVAFKAKRARQERERLQRKAQRETQAIAAASDAAAALAIMSTGVVPAASATPVPTVAVAVPLMRHGYAAPAGLQCPGPSTLFRGMPGAAGAASSAEACEAASAAPATSAVATSAVATSAALRGDGDIGDITGHQLICSCCAGPIAPGTLEPVFLVRGRFVADASKEA